MKIGIYDINLTEDLGIVRDILLRRGERGDVLNVEIPPNMKEIFEEHFANLYFKPAGYGWKLPEHIVGEYAFAMNASTEQHRIYSWSEVVGKRFSGTTVGIVRLSTHTGPRTIIIEDGGTFNREMFGNFAD